MRNWLGFRWGSEDEPEPPAPKVLEITLRREDDLLKRAENIVRILGFRGAVGDQILQVHEVLRGYEKLDSGPKP